MFDGCNLEVLLPVVTPSGLFSGWRLLPTGGVGKTLQILAQL